MKLTRLVPLLTLSLASGCRAAYDDEPSSSGPRPNASVNADEPQNAGSTTTEIARSKEDEALARALASEKGLGLQGGFATLDGKTRFFGATGNADVRRKSPLGKTDRFRIGSLTKTFTAALVMRHVERKKLALDDSIAPFFPSFPSADAITVRQLLSHTSGIDSVDNQARIIAGLHRAWEPVELVQVAAETGLKHAPGTAHHYSNINFIMLGMIVEKVGGASFETQLAEQITGPLEMRDTVMDPAHGVDRLVEGKEGALGVGTNVRGLAHMSIAWAAGALVSTADDVLSWMTGLFTGKVVREETLALMRKPAILADGTEAGGDDGQSQYTYGLGLITIVRNGKKTYGHSGATPGYRSYTFVDDARVVTVLSNNGGLSDVSRMWTVFRDGT